MVDRIVLSAGELTATLAGAGDLGSVQSVLEGCEDYFRLVHGQPPRPDEAAQLVREIPPSVAPEHRHVWLLWREGRPAGVLDFVVGYPTPTAWYVGDLLLLPGERSEGRGGALMNAFERHAHERGATELRVAVAEQNEGALRFWERRGYELEARVGPILQGAKESHFHRRVKRLSPAKR